MRAEYRPLHLGRLDKYGGAVKEAFQRIRETRQMMEGMLKAPEANGCKDDDLNQDIQTVAELAARIEAGKDAAPVRGVEDGRGRGGGRGRV